MMLAPLVETLAMLSDAASAASDPWWIIGSAAVVLHGHQVHDIKDVDLLMSAADAEALLRRVGASLRGDEPNERFRSQVFGAWTDPPVAVEIMGGFSVKTAHGWRDVSPRTRDAISVAGRYVYVPNEGELLELLLLFGRPKDLERAQLLSG